ncbi:MAG: PAS domain S-box protein [Bacteroidales bacterium]|nr:PAS domain S-box protein [Bacteroidales bacterium]
MDRNKDNAELLMRIRELEAYIEDLKTTDNESGVSICGSAKISLKKKFELLAKAQIHCKSGYIILSLKKELLEYTGNIREIMGLPEELTDLSFSDYLSSIVPGDRQHVEEIIEDHLLANTESSTVDFKIKGIDRAVHYIIQHNWLIHDSVYGEGMLFIILQNVTEQRRIERQLGYSETKFRSIFISTPLGMMIYTIDPKGNLRLTDVNPAARQILQLKDNSLIGKTIEEAFPPLAKTEIPLEYKKVACDGITWHGNEIEFHNGDIHFIFDITAFQTSLGTAAVIFQDITERKQVESLLRESEEKYRKLVDNSNVGVFTCNEECKVLYCNNTALQMLDFPTLEEISKADIEPLFAVDGTCKELMRLVKEQKKVSNFRAELITKKDRNITLSINAQLENNLISVVTIDITEKVRAEQKLIALNTELQEINEKVSIINSELMKSEALKKALLNNLPHMAWMKDKNGVYLSVNDSFARSLNLASDKIIGRTDMDLYPEKIAAKYIQEDKEVMTKRRERFFYEKTDGLWFETFKAPISSENGEIIGVSGISLEITERKRAEEEIRAYTKKLAEQNEILRIINDELVKAKERAEESDKLKSSFLANMSHEIRTPMNAILGFANLLKNKNFSDERKATFIEIINSKSKQLLQIITDIIDISKIEAGQISIFNKAFPVNALIKEMHLFFENIRKQDNKPVKIEYTLGLPDGEDYMLSDKIRIEQIISNFLSNAYKFTDSGTIEIGYKIQDTTIIFFVKDTGIGIALEEQKIVFDRFRQAESSFNRSYSGTGLGLAISKGLAERMGGQIYLESTVNKGSVFYLELPFIRQEYVAPIEKVFDESTFDWSDKTILIAEDEETNYTFLEVLLKVTGANIVWARNGIEAIDMCRENTDINLVLMDIKMPNMDGLEATRQIKKIRKTLPVIVQTAYAMSADEESCLESGCDAYISKPIKIEPLFKLIMEFI